MTAAMRQPEYWVYGLLPCHALRITGFSLRCRFAASICVIFARPCPESREKGTTPGHNVRKNPQQGLLVTQASPLELLKQARTRFTQREIAAHVGQDLKTVRRWEKGETPCPSMLEPALRDLLHAGAAGKQGA